MQTITGPGLSFLYHRREVHPDEALRLNLLSRREEGDLRPEHVLHGSVQHVHRKVSQFSQFERDSSRIRQRVTAGGQVETRNAVSENAAHHKTVRFRPKKDVSGDVDGGGCGKRGWHYFVSPVGRSDDIK